MKDPFISEGWSDKLYIVTAISNPERYRSRYELYKAFERHIKSLDNVVLITVELAFGERAFAVTQANNPNHVQLRTGGEDRKGHEIWHKENLLSIGVSRIPNPNWRYVAIVDADIIFQRHDIATETIHQLQHYDVVQMFSSVQDLCPNHGPLKQVTPSFCYTWVHHRDKMIFDPQKYTSSSTGHPGFCWAFRRDAWDKIGGIPTWGILGSGDRHLAYALVDKVQYSYHPGVHPVYKKLCKIYAVRCRHFLHRNIGYVPGLITHAFHGRKTLRGYNSRWRVLVDEQYNPELDIKPDWQGVFQLTERNWKLRDKIRDYFRSRNEDSIDL
jgi:hypothetical protein